MSQTQRAREDRLIRSMARFFEIRRQERISRINGELPRKQRNAMNSIIRQAVRIDTEQQEDSE